jgi:glycosyltransferase involved in cell wall biosynthesis
MTKVVVQIPCFNEEETLAETIADIPRRIEGVDEVKVLIIDDGSRDRTAEVARAAGADYIVRHRNNKGLAKTFRTGLESALRLGADIIVNTDGDNQYSGADIPLLVAPILQGRADIVIGDRQTHTITHFSGTKQFLQKMGSRTVRTLAGTDVPDAVSGFRAFSRAAALDINIVTPFSYTIESIIQASKKRYAIATVPIRTNKVLRPSRLFKSIPQFMRKSVATMVRTYVMYQPLRAFTAFGAALILIGLFPVLRFIYFVIVGEGDGHIQSLVIGSMLAVSGTIVLVMGLIADLINFNRQLLEIVVQKLRISVDTPDASLWLGVDFWEREPEPEPEPEAQAADAQAEPDGARDAEAEPDAEPGARPAPKRPRRSRTTSKTTA